MSKSPVIDHEWLGCKFFAKPYAKYLLDGIEVPHTKISIPLSISKIDGDRLWVGEAWINKDEVIPVADAAAFYTEYLRKHPGDAWGYHSRGHAWDGIGNCDNAITDYTKAIRLDPDYAIAYFNRGNVWADKGEFDKAIRDFNEAIRLNPEYVRAFFNRGAIWQEMDELDKAIKDYTEVVRLDPEDAVAYNNRGVLWYYKGEADKAIKDYSKAIWLDPQFVYAYSNRGLIGYYFKGEYYNAINDYTEAIRLDPQNLIVCNMLSWILATCPDAEFRDGGQAVVLAQQACELSEWKDADSLDTLAAAYAEAGDFAQAVKYQERCLEQLDEDVDKDEYTERLKLYHAGKPFHENGPGATLG